MSTSLRPYQSDLKADVYQAWQVFRDITPVKPGDPNKAWRNVAAVAPTGAGKTTLFADILHEHDGYACAIVHRQELVSQISCTLAREGVYHQILAPDNLVKKIRQKHIKKFGKSFYVPNSKIMVAGVKTIITRGAALKHFFNQVTLWVQDECHHDLQENSWGKAVEMMPNAKGLGVTATFERADGKGLGREFKGIFDVIVEAPTGRELIDMGYLSDYKIFLPESDLIVEGIDITASGEFSPKQLATNTRKSGIVGDVVKKYLEHVPGKKAIVFAVNVEEATKLTAQFRLWGVRAELIHAGTKEDIRDQTLDMFEAGSLDVLVNVDLFGEGFDVAAVEVVIMARATASFGLFCQQFGRALRPVYAPGWPLDTVEQRLQAINCGPKPRAIIIDHVGNVLRHGLPDGKRSWSLEGRKSNSSGAGSDAIKLKKCASCTGPYEAFLISCPHCGYQPVPAQRNTPKQVEGDLVELSEEAMNALRKEVSKANETVLEAQKRLSYAAPNQQVMIKMMNNHMEKLKAQNELLDVMAQWGGWQKQKGLSDREMQRKFYHRYGIDVMSCRTLPRVDTVKLIETISGDLK